MGRIVKAFVAVLLSAAAVFAQEQISLPYQAKGCPGLQMVIGINPESTETPGSGQIVCLLLDPAVFVIDSTTTPPTLRVRLPLPPNCTSLGSGSSFATTFAAGIPCNSLSLEGSSTISLPASPSFSQAELWVTYTGGATTTPIGLTWICPGSTCASLPSSPDVTSSGAVSLIELRYNAALNVWGGYTVSQTNGGAPAGSVFCSQGAAGPAVACTPSNSFPGNAASANGGVSPAGAAK